MRVLVGVETVPMEEPTKLKQGENYPQYDIVRSILKLYNNNNNLGFSPEASYRKLKALVSLIICPTGFAIIQYSRARAFTKPELVEVLALTWPRVNVIVNEYVKAGLIRQYGQVGAPYKPKGGRPVPIYGLFNIDPELVIEAQSRYGDSRGNHVSPDIEPEKVTEIVDLLKGREQVGVPLIENMIRQPTMKIPPVQRAEYVDRVRAQLMEKGVEVWSP